MSNKNKSSREKGFTLVELLAVIVILAIILVIAVPKVMSVIEDSKKATLESTAKMIASQAEKQKVQNTVLGNTDEITCESITNINDVDYEDCDIDFDNNTAKVTIKGSGKFDGLWVCDGTKTTAVATEEECALVCKANELMIESVTVIKPYEVKDYDSCVSYITKRFEQDGAPNEDIATVPEFCKGKVILENGSVELKFSDIVLQWITDGLYTERELIENNVIAGSIEEQCLKLTSEECFEFNPENGTITNYDESCGEYVLIPSLINNVTVTAIGSGAFERKNITYLKLPTTITKIGSSSFSENLIREIDIPSSVTYIGYSAFDDNPLQEVKIGNTSADIECSAFGELDSIGRHNIPEDSYVECE